MSGIYILKNVYSFAQILNLAASEQLQKWDESTLRKALNWAHYCEEVYRHVLQQGYAHDLHPKILQMSVLLTPPSFLTLSFDCLKTATKLLVNTILTNSNGSAGLKKRLETFVDPSVWSEVSGKIDARPPFNVLDKSFSMFWIQNQPELQIVKDRNSSIYANIILTNILTVMVESDNEIKFQEYCASLFDRLVILERGWELLVCIFTINPDSPLSDVESESMKKSLCSILLSWMGQKMNNAVYSPILELNLEVLRLASVNSSGFFTFYMSSLEKWGQCFQPCIDGFGNELWRDHGEKGASQLSTHFRHLLKSDCICRGSGKDLKSQVLEHLASNIKNSDFTVWRTVARSLLS